MAAASAVSLLPPPLAGEGGEGEAAWAGAGDFPPPGELRSRPSPASGGGNSFARAAWWPPSAADLHAVLHDAFLPRWCRGGRGRRWRRWWRAGRDWWRWWRRAIHHRRRRRRRA